MAFMALLPLLTSALSAAQGANKEEEKQKTEQGDSLFPVQQKSANPWDSMAPKQEGPLSSSWERVQALLNKQNAGGY